MSSPDEESLSPQPASGWLRLVSFIALVAAVGAGAVGWRAVSFAEDLAESQLRDRLVALAAQLEARIHDRVRAYHDDVGLVASRTRLRELLAERSRTGGTAAIDAETHRILHDALTGSRDLLEIWVAADATGRIAAATDAARLGRDVRSEPAFSRARTARHFGAPEWDGARWTAWCSAPVRLGSAEAAPIVVVAVRVLADPLAAILADVAGLGTRGAAFLVDARSGRAPQPLLWPAADARAPPPLDHESLVNRTAPFVELDDGSLLSHARSFEIDGFGRASLVTLEDIGGAIAPMRRLHATFLVQAVAVTSVAALLCLFVRSSTRKRLRAPRRHSPSSSRVSIAIAGAIIAATLAFDVLTPLGVAAGLPYAIAVLVSARARRPDVLWGTAVVSLAALICGYGASPDGGVFWQVIVNRALAAGVVVGAAVISDRNVRGERWIWRALDVSPSGVVVVDESGRIVFANGAATAIFGYGPGELIGREVEMLVPARLREEHVELRRRFAAAPSGPAARAPLDVTGVRKDGSEFPAQLALNPLQTRGGTVVLGALVDLTRSRQALELATKNAELEAKNAELDRFTYAASHDLQEPLRKLTAFSQLLERDLGDDLPVDARRDLDFIVDASRRMRALVQDLLALSRAGNQPLTRDPIRVDDCVDAALRALQGRVEETGAQISRDELGTVLADTTLLTQVYQNLLHNALKFHGDDPPRIHLTCRERDGEYVLGVQDQGIGFDPAHTDQVFAPFKKLHDAARYPGSGIGLAICRTAIARLDGELWVDAEAGRGAHFQFSLTAAGAALTATSGDGPGSRAGHRARSSPG